MKQLLQPAILLVALWGLTGGAAYAQTPESGGPTPLAPTAVPLDGGASLLLTAGVAYGLRRLRLRRPR